MSVINNEIPFPSNTFPSNTFPIKQGNFPTQPSNHEDVPEVKQALQMLSSLKDEIKSLNEELKKVKEAHNYKQLLEKRKNINEWFYNYMTMNNITELAKIKISTVTPSKEKKVIKKKEQKDKITNVLSKENGTTIELDEEVIDIISDKISENL